MGIRLYILDLNFSIWTLFCGIHHYYSPRIVRRSKEHILWWNSLEISISRAWREVGSKVAMLAFEFWLLIGDKSFKVLSPDSTPTQPSKPNSVQDIQQDLSLINSNFSSWAAVICNLDMYNIGMKVVSSFPKGFKYF